MNGQRLMNIDVVKGLTIFFMVLGHSYSGDNGEHILKWIYSFHMPLFFITTGILYGIRKNSNLKFDVKKKLKTILWPYLFWGTAYQLFLAGLKIIGGAPIVETIVTNLLYVIKLTGSSMWFLPIMFGALVIARLNFLLLHKNLFYFVSSVIIMLGSTIITTNNEFLATIIKMAIGAGFLAIGYCFAEVYNKKISLQKLILLTIAHIMLVSMNKTVSMASLTFGNPILYVLTSCIGTLVVYGWCQRLETDSNIAIWLGDLGRNSLKIRKCFITKCL